MSHFVSFQAIACYVLTHIQDALYTHTPNSTLRSYSSRSAIVFAVTVSVCYWHNALALCNTLLSHSDVATLQ
jgi:hypothetical protein